MLKNFTLVLTTSLLFLSALPSLADETKVIVSNSEKKELSKADKKESFLLLPFTGWKGARAELYQNLINEKLRLNLKKVHKFNTFDDKELSLLLNNIKYEYSLDKIVDLAREKGIKHLIIPKFTNNDLIFNDFDLYSNVNNIITRRIDLEIEVIDVFEPQKSIKFFKTIDKFVKFRNLTFYGLITLEFENITAKIVEEIEKNFPLFLEIVEKEENIITLNKGFASGVVEGQIFSSESLEKNNYSDSYLKKSYFRIYETYENTSKAFLISGITPNLNTKLLETKESPLVEGKIISIDGKTKLNTYNDLINKDNSQVIINLGEIHGTYNNKLFKVVEDITYNDTKNGKSFILGQNEKALISVTSTDRFFSKAKVIRGTFNISNNMRVIASKDSPFEYFFKLSYYNQYNLLPKLNNLPIYRISSGYQNITENFITDFNLDFSGKTAYLDIPDKNNSDKTFLFGVQGINGSFGYNLNLFHEYLSLVTSIEEGIVFNDFDGGGLRAQATPKASLKLSLGKVSLWADLGYYIYSKPIIDLNFSNKDFKTGLIYGGGLSVNF